MEVMITRCLLILLFGALSPTVSAASTTHLELALLAPVQFPSTEFSVSGLRLSVIMGYNKNMSGIDLAVIGNRTEQEFIGSALSGVFNWNEGNTYIYGFQIAGLANINQYRTRIYGLQAALFANLGETMDIYGVQIGLYNRARTVYGLQLGLINIAANLHGIQIGLANFNEGGPFTVAPLINVGF